MKICLIEPFYTGSHAAWAKEYQQHSRHEIKLLTLNGRHWKWRMHGGAVTLARQFLTEACQPDLLLATDMLDLTTFLALTRSRTADIPAALYCHENQLTYPWSPDDSDTRMQRDAHYAFINYSSSLAADITLFNSRYHLESWFEQLPAFLKSFPDLNELDSLKALKTKSRVLSLGMDLAKLDQHKPDDIVRLNRPPLILWNHRWEYDKNPDVFFQALSVLQDEGLAFEVAVLGESYSNSPEIFNKAEQLFGDRIIQFGYVENFSDYVHWLWQADIMPVTSIHDFFGASVVLAIYCQCTPLLPRALAYPEHVPAALHQHYLYQGFDDMLSRLRNYLKNPIPVCQQLRTHVARYDWQEMARQYDDLFEELGNSQAG